MSLAVAFRWAVEMRTLAVWAVEDELANAIDEFFVARDCRRVEVENANVVDGNLQLTLTRQGEMKAYSATM